MKVVNKLVKYPNNFNLFWYRALPVGLIFFISVLTGLVLQKEAMAKTPSSWNIFLISFLVLIGVLLLSWIIKEGDKILLLEGGGAKL